MRTPGFLHLTTTPEDLTAAAWLLARGAKLDMVTQFLTHELTLRADQPARTI